MATRVDQSIFEERIKNSFTYKDSAPDSIGAMLDFGYVSCDAESATATLSHTVDEREINIYGTLHGGIITWLMDTCMGITARSYTGYKTVVTMDIHVQFVRPINAGDETIISARVTHAGSKVVNLVSEMQVNGRICATADAIFYNVDQ